MSGLLVGAQTVGRVNPLRRRIVRLVDARLRRQFARSIAVGGGAGRVATNRRGISLAILHTMDRAVERGLLEGPTMRGIFNIMTHGLLARGPDFAAFDRFQARFGTTPPGTLAISPGKACNLRCIGCYANSGPATEKLDWATLDELVWQARELWGMRFFVLTGGEPLAYHHSGKSVLDLAAEHHDCFFMMYTNGTLIDARMAARIARLGNIAPAISIEGMRESTDERRGPGVFDKIVGAMRLLHREHVPFGISMTATRHTYQELLSDEVMDYFFGEMGAMFGWMFHYMPIGRSPDLSLMPTPQQRLWMLGRMWELINERYYFMMDLWNSGPVVDGCVAAGGHRGYLHVDWNGDVSPCVFMPYTPVNLHDLFARGKDLNDLWAEPFFARIREWQKEYNPRLRGDVEQPEGNLLRPCPIRDHHAEFRRMAREYGVRPTDSGSSATARTRAYVEGLERFDRGLARLLDPIWKADYLGAPRPGARRRKPVAESAHP